MAPTQHPILQPGTPATATSTCCNASAGCHTSEKPHQAAVAPATPAVATPPAAGTRRSRLHISAMDCPTEEALLRRALGGLLGVQALHFDLLGRVLSIDHSLADEAPLLRAVAGTGMQAQLLQSEQPAGGGKPGRAAGLAGPALAPGPGRRLRRGR